MLTSSLHPEPITAPCEPRGRFAVALTPRALLLLAMGLLWLIPGFFLPSLSYGMLAWDGLVLAACLFDGLRLPSPRALTVTRIWSNAPALGSPAEIEITLLYSRPNHSRSSSFGPEDGLGTFTPAVLDCRLIDDLPEALVETPTTHRFAAFANQTARLRYAVSPRERGDVPAGQIYARYRSGLGLIERWAKAAVEQPVRVYPMLRAGEEQQILLARSRQIDLRVRQMRQRGLGRDFESLRDYRQGDDLRDVCWTATARRGALITRQYQTERSQAVWIVLDLGRLMRARVTRAAENVDGGAGTGPAAVEVGYSKLDHACATAIALAQLALYSGDRVGLLAYGRGIEQQLLPGRGADHLRRLIEALAQARAENAEADHLSAGAQLNRLQPRRALVLWITDLAETAMRPEVIDGAMQLLKRHVVLFVAMAQPGVAAIADAEPTTVEAMFRSAAAQEMATRRELLLARLQSQGAHTLDLLPEALTSAVLNQYLSIKERALL